MQHTAFQFDVAVTCRRSSRCPRCRTPGVPKILTQIRQNSPPGKLTGIEFSNRRPIEHDPFENDCKMHRRRTVRSSLGSGRVGWGWRWRVQLRDRVCAVRAITVDTEFGDCTKVLERSRESLAQCSCFTTKRTRESMVATMNFMTPCADESILGPTMELQGDPRDSGHAKSTANLATVPCDYCSLVHGCYRRSSLCWSCSVDDTTFFLHRVI